MSRRKSDKHQTIILVLVVITLLINLMGYIDFQLTLNRGKRILAVFEEEMAERPRNRLPPIYGP